MNKKILIVDDEPGIHELLTRYLKKIEGVDIVNAYTGDEGIKEYKNLFEKGHNIVLIVMDLNLCGSIDSEGFNIGAKPKEGGKCDGVWVAEEILKLNPKATIWGYTAWYGTEWAEKLKAVGAQKVIDRIPFKEFAEMVRTLVGT